MEGHLMRGAGSGTACWDVADEACPDDRRRNTSGDVDIAGECDGLVRASKQILKGRVPGGSESFAGPL